MIGVLLSLGWLIYISTTPHMPVLGRQPGTQAFRGVEDHPDYETYPGLLVLRFDAGLFFASADALTDRLRELVQQADPPVQTIVLDFEGVNFIDSQGADKVAEISGPGDKLRHRPAAGPGQDRRDGSAPAGRHHRPPRRKPDLR